jgi:AcrR family transcriptional regulator
MRILRDQGYGKATLQNIARGAGITLGAIQHQFDTRDGLMLAVIDENFSQLVHDSELWSGLPEPLPERAHLFIQRAWSTVYGQPQFITSWKLFFGCQSSGTLFARIKGTRAQGDAATDEKLFRAFPELQAEGRQAAAFAQYFWSSLRGIALLRLFDEPERNLRAQLRILEDVLVLACSGSAAPANGRRTAPH